MDYLLLCEENENQRAQLIRDTERELRENYRKVQAQQEQNEFLRVVVDDYKRYYDHIRQQKQQQYDALSGLTEYIDALHRGIDATHSILDETHHDQKRLLGEMVRLQREMDEIIASSNVYDESEKNFKTITNFSNVS